MPINSNDFSIQNVILDSQFSAEDAASRIIPNGRGDRVNLQQKIREYTRNTTTSSTFRFPLDTPKYYMTLQIAEYSRSNLFNLNFQTLDTIILPMADQLVDNNSVAYTEEDLGIGVGSILEGGYNTATAAKNIQTNGFSLDSLRELIQGLGQTAGGITLQALQSALQAAPGATERTVTAAGQVLTGYSPNQFFTVLLKSPVYKQYVFMWRLFPKNLRESNEIKNIIYKLNNAKAVGKAGGGAFWKFPKIFRLAYYPNSQYMHKFKPAVIEQLSVNYAPGGTPAFYAADEDQPNPPESVVIQVQFKELEYWLDGDYIDDNDPYNTNGN